MIMASGASSRPQNNTVKRHSARSKCVCACVIMCLCVCVCACDAERGRPISIHQWDNRPALMSAVYIKNNS